MTFRMGRNNKLSTEEINKIQCFLEQNMSQREIARRINRSAKVINNFVKNKDNYGKNYKGRTKFATSARERQMILRAASNSTKSAGEIAKEIGTTVSLSTITRIINSAPYLKLKKKRVLNEQHISTRLLFAVNHMNWSSEWRKVLFTGEKKFNLDVSDGFNNYFHNLSMSCSHSALGSVMVWGAISYYGAIDIVVLQGKQTSNNYLQLLKKEYNKICDVVGDHQWVFQQDNASIHNAQEVKKWFKENNIEVLSRPPMSPDLNLIENVWSCLAREVYAGVQKLENEESLVMAIEIAWKKLDLNFIHFLYDSMPNRIFEVIRNNGKSTKY